MSVAKGDVSTLFTCYLAKNDGMEFQKVYYLCLQGVVKNAALRMLRAAHLSSDGSGPSKAQTMGLDAQMR